MDARIRQLRDRARHLADAARNADSMFDYNRLMSESAKAEDEADELEAQRYDREAAHG